MQLNFGSFDMELFQLAETENSFTRSWNNNDTANY